MSRQDWTKEQAKLAFHLYCQLPFGRLHSKNPEIIELAKLIGRTPGALAMKLVNFASLDPGITSTGRRGLKGASAIDREVWGEFPNDWEALALECADLRDRLLDERRMRPLQNEEADWEIDLPETFIGETKLVAREYRIKQRFFRRAVLSSYRGRCCMSGLTEERLLVASHIVPWSKDKSNRLNPSNGLSLSAIHDRAFDQGLITVTPDFRIKTSPALKKHRENEIGAAIVKLDGSLIALPKRFSPSTNFLSFHNENVFVSR